MRSLNLAELRHHNLLYTLVERQVVAASVGDVVLSPEQTKPLRDQFIRKKGLNKEDALEEFLLNQGLNEDDLNWQIELPLRVSIFCRENFHHKAEAHFLSRKNQLDRVVYSLLRVKDHALARELYFRIEAGEANFADLAAQFAEGPEKQTNGIIGPVALTQAHPVLAERLRTSRPGDLMEPCQIEDWWLVLRLESYTPASFDDSTAERMATELFNQWVRDETSRRIRALPDQGVEEIKA